MNNLRFSPFRSLPPLQLRDNQGREVGMFAYGVDKTAIWAATFTLPAPGAKTLSMHLTPTESKLTGKSEALALRDLPVPLMPTRQDY